MNKVYLIGHMVKDVELTSLNSGKTVGRFSLAVNRKYEQNGQKITDFINIVVWDKLADNMFKFCKKGSKVAVNGELQTRIYEVNGEKRHTFDVHANEVEFLSTKNDSGNEEPSKSELKPINNDTCPF
jgi:single-strand DNA-binding protein